MRGKGSANDLSPLARLNFLFHRRFQALELSALVFQSIGKTIISFSNIEP